MSLYAELNLGAPLIDSDEVSRYCKPSDYDRRRCEPKVSAFQRKRHEPKAGESQGELAEDALSTNRLQFFQLQDRDSAITCVIQEFLSKPYVLSKNGRFVVFNVGDAKEAAQMVGGCQLEFTYTPNPPVYSHSSIYNLPADPREELAVATAIKRLVVRSGMTFHAVS